MNRAAESILVLLIGGALLRISAFSDTYLRYVKPGLRWPLILAGALLVCAALLTLTREVFVDRLPDPDELIEKAEDPHEHGDGHAHGRSPNPPATTRRCRPAIRSRSPSWTTSAARFGTTARRWVAVRFG